METRYSTRIYFETKEELNMMLTFIAHLQLKTGWSKRKIWREALMDLNMKLDERGNWS